MTLLEESKIVKRLIKHYIEMSKEIVTIAGSTKCPVSKRKCSSANSHI